MKNKGKNHQSKEELDTFKITAVTCKEILEIDEITEECFICTINGYKYS